MALSPHELPDHGDELLGSEGLPEVLVGALSLAPDAIALLVLRAHEDHRHGLGAAVALETAQDLVPVALGHDDIEQEQIGPLFHYSFLQPLSVWQTDNVESRGFEDPFHQLEL